MTMKTLFDVMFAKNPEDLKQSLDNHQQEPVTDDQETEIITEFVAARDMIDSDPNTVVIATLRALEMHHNAEYDIKYYDLAELRKDLQAAYWSGRSGSTQPGLVGVGDPVYAWDFDEWRNWYIKRLSN
jgi:hypothetical protein